MAVEIGSERISNEQNRYLERARMHDLPDELLVEIFVTVATDREILSGEEQLHPDWSSLYSTRRPRITELTHARRLRELDETFLSAAFDSAIELINPNEAKICFLLGAGASKPAPSGIPTVKELLPDLLNRARRLDREEVTKLAEFCDYTSIDNIEDLLTAAQISEFCGRNPTILRLVEFLLFREDSTERRPRRSRRPSVDVSSVAFLQDTLQVLFGLLSSQMLPAEPNEGHKAIANYVKTNPAASIITTNYDCCIDRAMVELGVSYSYGLGFANEAEGVPTALGSSMTLIKLHGSLNWFYCDVCQTVHLVDIERTVKDYIDDRAMYPVIGVCKNCGGQRRGLLVPPLAMKFDVAPPLNPLIEEATNCFAQADVIVVVGFSFADADLYISRMVSKAIQANDSAKVVLFDPDPKVVEKVRSKFKARIPDFDGSRILRVSGDCAETLPKFLSGKLREEYQNKEGENTEESEVEIGDAST